MAYTNLIALRHKFLVGDFYDDTHSAEGNRLEFARRLYRAGKLSEFTPEQPKPVRRPNWWNVPTCAEEAASQWDFISAALKEGFGW